MRSVNHILLKYITAVGYQGNTPAEQTDIYISVLVRDTGKEIGKAKHGEDETDQVQEIHSIYT